MMTTTIREEMTSSTIELETVCSIVRTYQSLRVAWAWNMRMTLIFRESSCYLLCYSRLCASSCQKSKIRGFFATKKNGPSTDMIGLKYT
jgi:hypothetical protein